MPTTYQSSYRKYTDTSAAEAAMPSDDALTVSLSAAPLPDTVHRERFARRTLDVAIALALLLVSFPLFLILCFVVCATSPGAPFFRQTRVGRGGRTFRIWKFRTMYAGTQTQGPAVTAADDCRITPLGRWLRDNKLDELPQLFNVLKGDMSLVGPRPQVPRFVERFDPVRRTLVLAVRPGITGPTTLHFRSEERMLGGRLDREDYYIQTILPVKLDMDVQYVRTRSLAGDLGVLGQTLHLFSSALLARLLRHNAAK